ncbi:hypothetical protein HK100_006490, partial [Physocladia obscura]
MGANVSRTVKTSVKAQTNNVITAEQTSITSNVESPDSPEATIKLITSLSDSDITREYHGVEDSEYFLPSDIEEQDRLELQ